MSVAVRRDHLPAIPGELAGLLDSLLRGSAILPRNAPIASAVMTTVFLW
ncbi:hypothetical protein [Mycobacterium innocens]|nr:hypothetical protein [Mycobacterium innocens]